MNIEMHYSSGGHGGPYPTLDGAIERAKELLKGNRNERWIELRQGVNGELLAKVTALGAYITTCQ